VRRYFSFGDTRWYHLSNVIAGQKFIQFTVCAELAFACTSANHTWWMPPLKRPESKNQDIAIAFARGPGLLGSLLVGTCLQKACSALAFRSWMSIIYRLMCLLTL
jgi:hypothetical protein